jgi:glycine cleavage system H lipoate-binding protein
MTAGVVDYQLCPGMLDCKNCSLDAVIRRRFPGRSAAKDDVADSPPCADRRGQPQEGCLYSRSHWWVRETTRGRVRLGIETDLAHALLGLNAIVLPSLEQRVQQGRTCAWVVMEGATMPLQAPVGGLVRAVNHELIDKPHQIISHAFDSGWLCELEADADDAGMDALMDADEARERYAADRARFAASLVGGRRGKRQVPGITLADGGEPIANNADMIRPARYLALVRHAFCGTQH